MIFHRLDLDGCADQCNLEGFLAAGPEHCEVHFRTRGPSQKILHLVETQSLQALAVDGENAVPGFDSRARGRGIIDRRYDVDASLIGGNDETHSAVTARRLHLHFREGFWIEITRMRIEIRDHPIERVLDHFPVVG